MSNIKYCPKCGNTGVMLDGTACDCRMTKEIFMRDVAMLDIPEQYQGIQFNEDVIPEFMSDFYKKSMGELYEELKSMKCKNKNILLCSPKFTSKRVLAYSVVQYLFKKGQTMFPPYDVLELKKITTDADLNRKQTYTVSNPEDILTTPYLFVIIPATLIPEVYQTISTILDRRTRRNGCTIFIYDGSLESLTSSDYKNVIKNLLGDGSYGSLKLMEFWKKGESKDEAKS